MKSPDTKARASIPDFPIFIGGYRCSGTTLMTNLLDSHPDLLVWPDGSSFFFDYFPLLELENYSADEKIDFAVERLVGRINIAGHGTANNLDVDDLKIEFKRIIDECPVTPKNILVASMKAFKLWYQPNSKPKSWVLKTAISHTYATEIMEWFPNAKFIIMLRDPRDIWASVAGHWQREKDFFHSKRDLLQNMIEVLRDSIEFGLSAYDLYGPEKIMFVHYENLVSEPEKNMKKVADFLGITYDEILTRPTVLNIDWQGNNRQGTKFSGISSFNTKRWLERVDKEEAKIVEHYFSEHMKKLGYDFHFTHRERLEAAREHFKWFLYYHKSSSKGETGYLRHFYRMLG